MDVQVWDAPAEACGWRSLQKRLATQLQTYLPGETGCLLSPIARLGEWAAAKCATESHAACRKAQSSLACRESGLVNQSAASGLDDALEETPIDRLLVFPDEDGSMLATAKWVTKWVSRHMAATCSWTCYRLANHLQPSICTEKRCITSCAAVPYDRRFVLRSQRLQVRVLSGTFSCGTGGKRSRRPSSAGRAHALKADGIEPYSAGVAAPTAKDGLADAGALLQAAGW